MDTKTLEGFEDGVYIYAQLLITCLRKSLISVNLRKLYVVPFLIIVFGVRSFYRLWEIDSEKLITLQKLVELEAHLRADNDGSATA